MRDYCVYMLHCNDASFYIGITSDLPGRIAKHKEGWDPKCYTFTRRPLECVLVERYSEVRDAIAREKQLKRWSRAKKEALIKGDENTLHQFSRRSHLYKEQP
jgi:putative endonuclease